MSLVPKVSKAEIYGPPRTHGDEPMKKAIHFVEGVSAPYVRG